MGWNNADDKAFVFKGGHSLADTPPVLRRKLRQSPMLMPTFGWPEGTTVDPAKLPDWSWRLKPTLDIRPESQRPPPGQLRALDPPETRVQAILANHAEPGKELMAYATIAARHMDQFGTAPAVLPYLVQRASLDGHAEEVRPELAPMQPPAF
jgi:hypothetical protein